jgi:hypothetical protein
MRNIFFSLLVTALILTGCATSPNTTDFQPLVNNAATVETAIPSVSPETTTKSSPTISPTPKATVKATIAATKTPTPTKTATPKPIVQKTSEPVQDVNPSGATARCKDGTLSYSANRRGTCSHHGGVAVWY